MFRVDNGSYCHALHSFTPISFNLYMEILRGRWDPNDSEQRRGKGGGVS